MMLPINMLVWNASREQCLSPPFLFLCVTIEISRGLIVMDFLLPLKSM